MRIVIVGAGAVGSYFGGALARGGSDVVFLSRGKNLEALRRRPLRVASIKGDFEVKVGASDSAEEIGSADAILVAVKAWQVPEVAPALRPLLGAESVVVPLQNGVEAAAQLASTLGAEAVAGGFCKIIAYMVAPAHVKHAGAEPEVAFGELQTPTESPRLRRLQSEFARAGVTCQIPADITAAMWAKFIFIAAISGVAAQAQLPIGEVRSRPASRAQLAAAIAEIVAVGRAHGVALGDEIAAKTLRYVDNLPTDGTASMQRDIMEGRPSELESQTGAVVRLGRAVGVPTPTNSAIYQTLLPLERRARGL